MHVEYSVCVTMSFLLEREREVVLTGLAVPHQVTGFFTQAQQSLGVCPADGSVIPAVKHRTTDVSEEEQQSLHQASAVCSTHNWLSRGTAGSMRSPTLGSAELIFPLECRCSGRHFRSFSTPSNCTVTAETQYTTDDVSEVTYSYNDSSTA